MRHKIAMAVALAGLALAARAAEPPSLVNYQGVLRNASDDPLTGNQSMVFRFFSLAAGGDEILVDRHTVVDGNPVVATGGLFNVLLGGGIVVDGSGPGAYVLLTEVFRDYAEVHMSVEVGGEVLAPRIRVASSAYALNADHLEGLDSGQLLRSDASDTFTSGTLSIDPGTTLDVAGTLQLSGVAVTSDADELNKLDGTGIAVNAGNLNALTHGGIADLLHFHTNTDANQLGGLTQFQFLRSDASDNFTSGTLTLDPGTSLDVDGSVFLGGELRMREGGGEGDQAIYFFDDGSDSNESLAWSDAKDRFDVSNDLGLNGRLVVASAVRAGGGFLAPSTTYHHFGDGVNLPGSGDMTDVNDLFVSHDLEVDDVLYLNGRIDMSNNGPEGDQRIFFYDDGAPTNEALQWDDLADRFSFSNDLAVAGSVDFGIGASDDLTAADVTTLTGGGTADALHTHALVQDADRLDGNDSAFFLSTSAAAQVKTGNLTVADATLSGDDLFFAGGSRLTSSVISLTVSAGAEDTDDLVLNAGNSTDDGGIFILGDANMSLTSGDGLFRFFNGSTGASTANLDASGNLHIDGFLELDGNSILFATLATISSSAVSTRILAGDADTDVIVLDAGNSSDDGRLLLNGDGAFDFNAGNGVFNFSNAGTGVEIASLNAAGTLQLDGDLDLDGNDLTFGAGSQLVAGALSLSVRAGDADGDSLELMAGNSLDDGRVLIIGDGKLELRSGNGLIEFTNGATATISASLSATGNLQIDGDLTVSGNTILAPGSLTLDGGTGFNVVVQSDFEALTHVDFDATTAGETADWCANGNCTGANHLMELQEDGDLRIGGVLSENQFDLAESYLRSERVEPGDLVRLDPERKGAVLLARGADDGTVLGIVSERPGVVLGGAPFGVDALGNMWGDEVKARFLAERDRRIDSILMKSPDLSARRSDLQSLARREDGSENEGLAAELSHLDAKLESKAIEAFYAEHFAPIALAGRVPVKVDAQFGAIEPGDPLGPSSIPGVARKASGDGPVVAIALEGFPSGRGKVEAFVTRGSLSSATIRAAQRQLASELDERTPDPVTGIQTVPGHFQVVLDRDANDEARFSVFRDGDGGEAGAEVFRVDEQGNVFAKGSFRPASMDMAELFELSEPAGVGDVLVADRDAPGRYRLARSASDPAVIGVVAGEPGVMLGAGIERVASADPELAGVLRDARRTGDREAERRVWKELESKFYRSHASVALSGTVLVKADAGYGAIRVGDLLTSSPTSGHAMRAQEQVVPGTVLGKALEPIQAGTGLIRMLVMLR